MSNTHPCGQCEFFDPVVRGTKATKWGWCMKYSVYPTKEGPGQIFPKGVKRAAEGDPSKPRIVKTLEVVAACPMFAVRKAKPTKQELLVQLETKGGKRVLR